MDGIAEKNGERLPTSPVRMLELDPARHEIRANGMDADVPKTGLPAQVWVRPQANTRHPINRSDKDCAELYLRRRLR